MTDGWAAAKVCAGCSGKLWKRGDHRVVVTYRRKYWHDDCAKKHPLWWRDFNRFVSKNLGARIDPRAFR